MYESPFLISYKKTTCKFCDCEIVSKHFARHLERNHISEPQVKEIFMLKPQGSKRKKMLALIRNEGNMDSAIRGQIKPKKWKKGEEVNESDYAICKFCKGYFKKFSLCRHIKNCFAKPATNECSNNKPLIESLVFFILSNEVW